MNKKFLLFLLSISPIINSMESDTLLVPFGSALNPSKTSIRNTTTTLLGLPDQKTSALGAVHIIKNSPKEARRSFVNILLGSNSSNTEEQFAKKTPQDIAAILETTNQPVVKKMFPALQPKNLLACTHEDLKNVTLLAAAQSKATREATSQSWLSSLWYGSTPKLTLPSSELDKITRLPKKTIKHLSDIPVEREKSTSENITNAAVTTLSYGAAGAIAGAGIAIAQSTGGNVIDLTKENVKLSVKGAFHTIGREIQEDTLKNIEKYNEDLFNNPDKDPVLNMLEMGRDCKESCEKNLTKESIQNQILATLIPASINLADSNNLVVDPKRTRDYTFKGAKWGLGFGALKATHNYLTNNSHQGPLNQLTKSDE